MIVVNSKLGLVFTIPREKSPSLASKDRLSEKVSGDLIRNRDAKPLHRPSLTTLVLSYGFQIRCL